MGDRKNLRFVGFAGAFAISVTLQNNNRASVHPASARLVSEETFPSCE